MQIVNALEQLWTELLEVPNVGSSDNFIECGGNSLLATILAARIDEDMGCEISLEEVFQLEFRELVNIVESQYTRESSEQFMSSTQ